MRQLTLLVLPILFIGCSNSKTYQDFQEKFGADEHIYCNEAGFLIRDVATRSSDDVIRYIVTNDAGIPTRCNVNNISVQVKETVATGLLSGDIR